MHFVVFINNKYIIIFVSTLLGNFLVFKGIFASIEKPDLTGISKSPITTLYLDVSPSLPPEGLFTVGLEA